MRLFHHYHGHSLWSMIKSPFWEFEASIWLHVFARSLISIFIPLFLLTAGFSIGEIVVFFLILMGANVPFNFIADRLVRAIGARWVMTISTIFTVLFFALLSLLKPGDWTILIAMALCEAIYDALYFVSHIYLFIRSGDGNKGEAKEISILLIVKRIAMLLGPAVGASILLIGGKQMLILTSIIFFILSIFPLLFIPPLADRPKTKRIPIKDFFSSPTEKRDFITLALFGVHESTEAELWPLFIFAALQSVESIAAVPIIVSIGAIIFSYAVGSLKKKHANAAIMLGSALIALVWLIRLTNESPFFYYLSVFIVGFCGLLVLIPLLGNIYERARKTEILSVSTYRNAASMLGRFILFLVLAIAINVFQMSFITALTSVLVILFINAGIRTKKKA